MPVILALVSAAKKKSLRPTAGVVAAGHAATAEAGQAVLEAGGNAFDAVLAALLAACVAEPLLASLGGGGFLLAHTAQGEVRLFDFFAQTPRHPQPEEQIDFFPIHADFGETVQEFHIGLASIACPGVVAGLFEVHKSLARLPLARLVEPAAALARQGVEVNKVQAYVSQVLKPIIQATAASRQLFCTEDGEPIPAGGQRRNPELGAFLEHLAAQPPSWFYRGEPAETLVRACREHGGLLTADDLAAYRVEQRSPLRYRHGGARLTTNPLPSSGGTLIALGMRLLDGAVANCAADSGDHLEALVRTMLITARARRELRETRPDAPLDSLLDEELVAALRRQGGLHRPSTGGTTQISAADGEGNLASLTVTNGEGCGTILPGTGIHLNNMLGEEDLNPGGFHLWAPGRRLSSMMAPTLAETPHGRWIALGSGGSNRLRTAILQVLVRLLDFGAGLEEAVRARRLHCEGQLLHLEPGWPEEIQERLSPLVPELKVWRAPNPFFGGVHSVLFDPRDGHLEGAADARRQGAVRFSKGK